jgi:hypothetical protein
VSAWSADELARIGGAGEVDIATRRADGTLRTPRIVWVVRLGDGLYVRSVNGPDAAWFRGARTRMQGHIQAGGMDRDVAFVDADHDLDDAIDEAYRAKYRSSPSAVDHITSAQARSTTIELVRAPSTQLNEVTLP